MFRPVTLLAALLSVLAVAGCSAAAGMEKTTSPRRTVEMPKYNLNKPELMDAAFAPSKLRALDVCATLAAADLAQYGTPAPENLPDGLGTCANYMKGHNGKDLNITLYFDAEVHDGSKHNIGGLPSEISDNGDTCFVRSAYFGGEPRLIAPARGLAVQLSGEQVDLCSIGVQIMADVIDVVRTRPPVSRRVSGSLTGFDPCGIVDASALRDAVAGGNADSTGGQRLFECEWYGDNGVILEVGFLVGKPEKGSIPPVDLGGVLGEVLPSPDPPACQVEWEHRAKVNDRGDSEYVHVEVLNSEHLPMDPCVHASNLARAVRGKLPTG
ncbi:hypothetical protein GCM10011581_06950 [Saccharopolyspora subtropica]|uniref:DUF3558 domain-containing protein n=1 Tax=Saccharopolyspora thermophila TaxID=89367 RepID=A0A917JL13_9PSEU|nr:hypothetical protein [Saccharopolyspora subtropica]GGI72597.1 hypothetical protein GCM10011581_06950 [Saccharopolyspora subtropica]